MKDSNASLELKLIPLFPNFSSSLKMKNKKDFLLLIASMT